MGNFLPAGKEVRETIALEIIKSMGILCLIPPLLGRGNETLASS